MYLFTFPCQPSVVKNNDTGQMRSRLWTGLQFIARSSGSVFAMEEWQLHQNPLLGEGWRELCRNSFIILMTDVNFEVLHHYDMGFYKFHHRECCWRECWAEIINIVVRVSSCLSVAIFSKERSLNVYKYFILFEASHYTWKRDWYFILIVFMVWYA